MADEEKKEDEIDVMGFINSPLGLMIVAAILIVGIYFIVSPIQNCLRDGQIFTVCTDPRLQGLKW